MQQKQKPKRQKMEEIKVARDVIPSVTVEEILSGTNKDQIRKKFLDASKKTLKDTSNFYRAKNVKLKEKEIQEREKRFARGIERIDISIDKSKKPSDREIIYLTLVNQRKKQGSKASFDELLSGLSKKLDSEQRAFHEMLLKLRYNEGEKLSLPTRLCNDEINVFFCYDISSINNISNDWLFMSYLGNICLDAIDPLKAMKDIFTVKNIKVVSEDIFEVTKDVEIYYTEDFETDVYANDYASLSKTQQQFVFEDIKEYGTYDFILENKKYSALSMTNFCTVIYPNGTTEEKLKTLLEKGFLFHKEKGEFHDAIKKVPIKKKYCYITSVLNPTKFCPGNIKMNEKIRMLYLVKYKMDLDGLFQHTIKEGRFMMVRGSMNWDNYKTFIEYVLLLVYFQRRLNINIKGIQNCEDISKLYSEVMDYIEDWKRHYENFKKIVMGYLDCFSNKIKLDKLEKLIPACEKFLSNDDYLISQQLNYNNLLLLLLSYGEGSVHMTNFLYAVRRDVILGVMNACERLSIYNTNTDITSLMVRAAALSIYSILINGPNPMIPDLRSEAAFLGNVSGSYANERLIEVFAESVAEEKKKIKKDRDKALKNVDKKKDLIMAVLGNTLTNMTQSNYIPPIVDEIKEYIEDVWEEEPYIPFKTLKFIEDQKKRNVNEDSIKNMIIGSEFDNGQYRLYLMKVGESVYKEEEAALDEIMKANLKDQEERKKVIGSIGKRKIMKLKKIKKRVQDKVKEDKELAENVNKIMAESKYSLRSKDLSPVEAGLYISAGGKASDIAGKIGPTIEIKKEKEKEKKVIKDEDDEEMQNVFNIQQIITDEDTEVSLPRQVNKKNLKDIYDRDYVKSLNLGYEIDDLIPMRIFFPSYILTDNDINNIKSSFNHPQLGPIKGSDLFVVKYLNSARNISGDFGGTYIFPFGIIQEVMKNAIQTSPQIDRNKFNRYNEYMSKLISGIANKDVKVYQSDNVKEGLYYPDGDSLFVIENILPAKTVVDQIRKEAKSKKKK